MMISFVCILKYFNIVEYFISCITSMDAQKEDKQPKKWLYTTGVCAGL